MSDELLDLKNAVGNAADWLATAERLAGNLCRDDAHGELIGWKEMESACERIAAVRAALAAALEPVAETIQLEEEYRDDMADRADGLSY
jgi:hypothetical protein